MVLFKKTGESKQKGFVNFVDKGSAFKAIHFFRDIQTTSNERKRAESIETINPSLEKEFMKMKVSSATRKDKQISKKLNGRARASTEPFLQKHSPPRSESTNMYGLKATDIIHQQTLQVMQPVLCYVPVVPVTQVSRSRSSTEPYITAQQPIGSYQYLYDPINNVWYYQA